MNLGTLYGRSRGELEQILTAAKELADSTRGMSVPDWRLQAGYILFGKAVCHAEVVLRIAPADDPEPGEKAYIDLASMAVLTRALVEAYLVMRYAACEEVSVEEAAFRPLLWSYHNELARLKSIRGLNGPQDDEAAQAAEVERMKARLRRDPVFLGLPKPQQDQAIAGRMAWVPSGLVIAAGAGISARAYKEMHRFCSQYAHSYPFCVSQLIALIGAPAVTEMMGSRFLMECTGYLCHAVRDWDRVAHPSNSQISEATRELIARWEERFRDD